MAKKKKGSVTPPEKHPRQSKSGYWTPGGKYPGVTSDSKTGETKGKHPTPKRNVKGKRGHSGRKYTGMEKSVIKGLSDTAGS